MTKPLSRRTVERHLKLVATVVVVVGFGWYISSNWTVFSQIRFSSPSSVVIVALITVTNIYTTGRLLDVAIEPHGVKLSRRETFGLSVLTRFGNYVSPGYLGTAIRAYYLKKQRNVNYTRFSSSFVLSNVLQLLASGAAAAAMYVLFKGYAGDNTLVLLTLAIMLFMAAVSPLASVLLKQIETLLESTSLRMLNVLANVSREYRHVRSKPLVLAKVILWSVLSLLSSTFVYYFAYQAVGTNVSLTQTLFIVALANWTVLMSITPGGLGVREGLLSFGAVIVGVPVPPTIAASIAVRLITFAITALLSVYFANTLLQIRIKNLQSLKDNPRN